MKTDELIQKLSAEPPRPRPPLGLWLAGASLGAVAALAAVLFFLPVSPFRADLALQAGRPRFWGESFLWLSTSVAAFSLMYRLSLPGVWRRRDIAWGLFPAALLILALFCRGEAKGIAADWGRELDWYRGFCGPVILFVGILQAGLLAWVVRKAAPTRLAAAGFWIAFGAGSLGSFLMQFVCHKENFAHVVFWHLSPVLVLALGGALLGRKVLKW